MGIDKYEEYSLGHHLSDWPVDWTYAQIMDELENGDPDHQIVEWVTYEGIPATDLATLIADMTKSLRVQFK